VPDANADVSRLIKQATKPLPTVVRVDAPEPKNQRRLGFMRGQLKVPDDFDRMGQEQIEEMFGLKT